MCCWSFLSERLRDFICKSPLNKTNFTEICSRGAWEKITVDVGFRNKVELPSCNARANFINKSITIALVDCNQELVTFDLQKPEVDAISHLVTSLEPVKFGAEKQLGDRTSTLLSAEGIFSFILNELELLNNLISIKLHVAIIKRIEKRRNSNLVGMLHYPNSERITRGKLTVACQFFLIRLYLYC